MVWIQSNLNGITDSSLGLISKISCQLLKNQFSLHSLLSMKSRCVDSTDSFEMTPAKFSRWRLVSAQTWHLFRPPTRQDLTLGLFYRRG